MSAFPCPGIAMFIPPSRTSTRRPANSRRAHANPRFSSSAWLAYRRLNVHTMRLAASVSEAVALACFMFSAVLRPAEFHRHAMSLAIMLIVVYLYIPNSFVNALLLVLANAFGALAARRFNRVSREEYRAQTQLQHAAERQGLRAFDAGGLEGVMAKKDGSAREP